MAVRRSIPLLLLGLCAACGDGPLAPYTDLASARSRWQAAGPPSYVFDLQLFCFCLQETYGRIGITVVNGRFVDAITSDGAHVDTALFRDYLTVDRALERIGQLLAAKPASFRATYDPVLGYPTEVSVDPIANAVDDELTFRILSLQAVLPP